MIHRYEGVCVAFVRGTVEAGTREEARDKLVDCDYGIVDDIILHDIILLNELDAIREEDCEGKTTCEDGE